MQLSPIHFRNLAHSNRQLRSDYTIKATGAPDSIDRHREDIEQFARSFELIEELPEPHEKPTRSLPLSRQCPGLPSS